MISPKKTLLLFSALLLLLSLVCSQTVEVADIGVSPAVSWINENPRITVSARCLYNGSAVQADDARVDIQSPSGLTTTENLLYSGGTYSSSFSLYGFSEVGTYQASVTCEYKSLSDNKKKTFTLRNMELSILKEESSIEAYMGESFEVKVDFRVDGSPVSLAKDNYEIEIGGEEAEVLSVIGTSSYQKITIDPCPDGDIEDCMDDLPEGLYDLDVTAYYSTGRSVSDKLKNYIRISPPMKLEFKTTGVTCAVGSICTPSISFEVSDAADDASDLDIGDISARILGNRVFESAYIDDLQCDKQSGSCTVKLNIPANLQPGEYDLFIAVEKDFGDDSYVVEEPLELEVVLQLSGYMRDAAGETISSVFTLTDLKTGQVISDNTDYAGKYALDVLPGDYLMEARFSGTLVRFNNVSISSQDFMLGLAGNLIRYDEGHINSEGPSGVKPIKVFVVEFALPFSSVWFYATYDSALVNGDENNLRVYRCGNWNFEKGSCTGQWSSLNAEVHTIRNAVEFASNSTAAFVIGEQRALYLRNVELGASKVFMGENVVIDGKVIDSEGQGVEGAQIKFSFPSAGVVSSASSTTGGFFRGTITAPYVEGYPDLVIEASKTSYAPASMTSSVGVEKKKAVSLFDVPESVSVKLDEPKKLTFRVFNSGQVNLSDTFYVKVGGIPSSWYTLSTNRVDGLDVSESKEIELVFSLTSAICSSSGCDQFSLVNLEVSSDSLTDTASFTLNVQEAGGEQGDEMDSSGGVSLPSITGFSIAVPSVGNPYLPLTIIILLVILIVNKKKIPSVPVKKTQARKPGKGAPKLRDSVMISLNNIKRDI